MAHAAEIQKEKQFRWVSSLYEQTAAFFAELTTQVLASYKAFWTVHRHGEEPLPTMPEVVQTLGALFAIISPGYGRREHGRLRNKHEQVRFLLARVFDSLVVQVERDLRFSAPRDNRAGRDFAAEAREVVNAFLGELPRLIQQLEEDIATMFLNDPAAKSLELILICYPGVYAIRTYRIAHILHRLGLTLIPRMMTEYAHSKTGVDIHPGAVLGRRFAIDHATGVVIGETSIIGDDVTILQGVTIGARKFPRDEHGSVRHDATKRHPTIGNRVVIYANATILGGDTIIGDDVIIGASTWIEESVEPRMIVTNEKPKQRYIKNRRLPALPVDESKERTDQEWERLYFEHKLAREDDL
jgi:serine O-acetyltransferase